MAYRHVKYLQLIYLMVNIYPLYIILEAGLAIQNLLPRLLILALTVIWFAGVYRVSPHILIIYYVVAGILLIASGNIYITPQLVIAFTLLAFLSDYMGRLVIGFKWRRTRISLIGLIATTGVLILVVGLYVYTSYMVAGLSNIFVEEIVSNTPSLFKVFFDVFISSRLGSLFVFVIIVFVSYYVLSEYITNTISDTILLTPSFALHRIIYWVKDEGYRIINGVSDFQKLYSRTFFIVISFYIYILLFPLYGLLLSRISGWISYILSFAIWLLLSIIMHQAIRRKLIPTPKPPSIPRLKVSRAPLIISIILLTIYIVILYVEKIPVFGIVLRSISLSGKSYIFYSLRDVVSRTYYMFAINYYYYSWIYIDKLSEAYQLLNKLLEFIIKFLWG